jgi:iron complex transport system substrate-binding protein
LNGGRLRAHAVGVLVALLLSACGGSSSDDATATTVTTTAAPSTVGAVTTVSAAEPPVGDPPVTTAPNVTAPATSAPASAATFPPVPERVVALSEEILLADLLAIGVTPVASTSNNPDGFPGIDPALTTGTELIFSPEFNLEALAALRPDLIVVQQQYLDLGVVDRSTIEAIAPVEVIPGDDWRTTLLAVGAVFGRESLAEEIAAGVDAAFADASATLSGRELSVVSILPGPLVRAYADGGIDLIDHLLALGVQLRPGPGTEGVDATGRIVLSEERFDVFDAPAMLMLQSDLVDGEADARAAVEASALWQTLPAVASGDVVVLDRLGYPGALGAAAFVADVAAALG